ncbi:hypothetical protein HBI24_163160 [Parastagonospora nodorum]|nr:hypothetical protein HBI24_163160 [Parastagonospora nodorum]
MDLARYFSTGRKGQSQHHSPDQSRNGEQSCLPLLANPINEDVREVLSGSFADLEKMNNTTCISGTSTESLTLGSNGRTSRDNVIIYKRHHEASSIELFYDLFFVANLAYFTAMHQHTDAQALIDYLKLFTLIWFTWLSTTLFDVRFSIDCVWNRIHKAIQFGVFTGFVFAGPVFDRYTPTNVATSYRQFGIVLVVSRIAIVMQYGVVMWQGRMFRQTLVPLGLSTAVHAMAAVAYGITIGVYPRGAVGLEEQVVWLCWVIISIVEGLLIFLIAIIWRIVSFKYTHLIERLQLLTLIIIGEGIIGMVKSVACIFKGQSDNNSTEIGTVVAAVVLLYLLYMLYFDQLSHDRFGTVRQQIWSLLHYPLHMAILLCVEGNTSLITWNTSVQALRWMWDLAPDFSDPSDGFDSTSDLLSSLNRSMWQIDARFPMKYWNATNKWHSNFTAIENYTATYGFRSDEWNSRTGELIRSIFDNAQVFVFEAHADTLGKLNAVSAPATDPRQRLERIYAVFDTAVLQFYIGAGAVLLVLAVMYWFNKLHKTKYEFGEIINRMVVGFALMIVGVATVIGNKSMSGFKFVGSAWIIPVVVFCYVAVLLMDNFLLAMSYHTSRRRAESDDDADHIEKSSPRADDLSTSLSRVQTAYSSPSRSCSPTPPKVRFDIPAKQVQTSAMPRDDASRNLSQHNRSAADAIGGLGMVDVSVGPIEREIGQERNSRECTCRTRDDGADVLRDGGDHAQNMTVKDL